jgi:mediator of RNA polymerase II transcription subunit 23
LCINFNYELCLFRALHLRNVESYINFLDAFSVAVSGKPHFPATDWRFNEFPNPAAHALYVTCVELMAVPVTPALVGTNLLDVVAKG